MFRYISILVTIGVDFLSLVRSKNRVGLIYQSPDIKVLKFVK